ncbi:MULTISPECIES: TraB/GumN family protein [unclassified Flavobacterium]|uniref:TraB/GumN family protein n=1 Tax=unclassified Flavobacterium TaxID=196869 RepID=UPI001F13DBA2|nr:MULTISPECIES: TraB/GumN family protein [unclassified Flavobacterium]UMY65487.1 TraB/GumN family protein [Flavobacterium sp. HJ-32-4]
MKQLLAFIALGSSLLASAQTLEKSLLWRISGNGIQTSYLYGTIHMTCDNTLDDATKKAIATTKQLYLELDMDDPGMMPGMMKGINMKDGVTMDRLASADDYKLVDAFFKKKMGVGIDAMKTMKPMMLSAMLLPAALGCTPKSIEEALMTEAKNYGEETFGLETVEEQLAVFDAIPYKIQMEELVKTARGDGQNDMDELAELVKLYGDKDLDALVAASEKSENRTTAEFGDVLLKDRNKNWIPRILRLIKEKPTFFGVGAAHLGGPDGVIRLLRKMGYTVEAVK